MATDIYAQLSIENPILEMTEVHPYFFSYPQFLSKLGIQPKTNLITFYWNKYFVDIWLLSFQRIKFCCLETYDFWGVVFCHVWMRHFIYLNWNIFFWSIYWFAMFIVFLILIIIIFVTCLVVYLWLMFNVFCAIFVTIVIIFFTFITMIIFSNFCFLLFNLFQYLMKMYLCWYFLILCIKNKQVLVQTYTRLVPQSDIKNQGLLIPSFKKINMLSWLGTAVLRSQTNETRG